MMVATPVVTTKVVTTKVVTKVVNSDAMTVETAMVANGSLTAIVPRHREKRHHHRENRHHHRGHAAQISRHIATGRSGPGIRSRVPSF